MLQGLEETPRVMPIRTLRWHTTEGTQQRHGAFHGAAQALPLDYAAVEGAGGHRLMQMQLYSPVESDAHLQDLRDGMLAGFGPRPVCAAHHGGTIAPLCMCVPIGRASLLHISRSA